MIKLAGYRIGESIFESKSTIIYRGHRELDSQPVVFKFLNKEYPSPEEIARFKGEYELTKRLNIEGAIKVYSLEKYKNTLIMILEDFGGESLRSLLHSKDFLLEDFYKISIKITEVLALIHQKRIMHKDINPSNILWNRRTGLVKIIDFGISTELPRETTSVLNPDVLEGTLPYMSPEQTGRMNRAMDYRTDFYSLGVTLYEILTGQLPFSATDPIELVHCHIAKTPLAPHELNPQIPYSLSMILMKLMAKTAEERYQTSYGLKWDLQQCLEFLNTGKNESAFKIGERDISDQFQIPQKLYGREEEVASLLSAFDHMSQGDSALLLVAGYSGVGKSALVHEVHKSIAKKRGYFIDGKFDQFQRNVPYSALIRAFQNLVWQILSESADHLEYWKKRLLESLGTNGQIIIDLIPEMEQIIGKQPPVSELNPTDSRNRFLITFRNFIKALTHVDHSLVIFLDDLQWSDSPTLNLISDLVSSKEIRHLFLIGAYRDNEVTEGHPLNLTLYDIEKTKSVYKLNLKPLKEDTINQILADTLHRSPVDTKQLSELIYKKTEGNPFFVNTLLKSLNQEGHIYFIHDSGKWDWSLDKIQKYRVSENVVEFMIGELQKLSIDTREVLQIASCMGNRFDLKTLSMIYGKSSGLTADLLWEAVRKEIIIPLDAQYRLFHGKREEDAADFDYGANYQFSHDRVQQAAYALIEEGRAKNTHLVIGRIMHGQMDSKEQEEKLVEMVGHLNEGRSLITDAEELENLARLNLTAARKAKASTAYRSALQYLTIGKELLKENSWNLQYDLTFHIYQEYAACSYLCSDYDSAESHSEVMLQNSKTSIEKVKIRSMQLLQYSYGRKMDEANRAGILGLELLGIKISEKPGMLSILKELLLAKKNLGKRKIEDLINQPIITDEKIKLAMKILIDFIPPSYLTGNSNLFALVVLKQVNLSLVYGNSPEAASIYASYAVLLTGMGDLKSSDEFGKLALKLNERFNDMESKCRTFTLYTIFCHSWNYHWKTLRSWYSQAIEAGLRSGDLLFMAHSCYYVMLFDPEIRLNACVEQYKKYIALVESSPYPDALDFILIQQNYRLSMLHGFKYNSESEELIRLDRMKRDRFISGVANYHLYQLMTCFAYGAYTDAMNHIKEGDKVMHSLAGGLFVMEFALYSFLTYAALFPTLSYFMKIAALRRMKKEYKKMKKWANHCPVNFLHLQLLMEAEFARVYGNVKKAGKLYELAIETAGKNEYHHYEALANELAGQFYLGLGQVKFALIYLRDAHYGYNRWGASGKVHYLEERYPQLIVKIESDSKNLMETTTRTTTFSGERGMQALDLTSVMKASQTISSEITHENLMRKMMTVIMENAGAEKGFLILNHNGYLKIEAEGNIGQETIIYPKPVSIENQDKNKDQKLSLSIVRYVEKIKKPLVLGDAAKEGLFTEDEYVAARLPKSVLCAPILYQNKLTGIIYLENNLTAGAFTPDRLEVLGILSTQTAISFENAGLYSRLEEKVMERTVQLEEAHKKIILLEKESTEKQMAGGFAHEMRNALVGPKLVIQQALGFEGSEPYVSLNLENSRKLKEIYLELQKELPPEKLANILKIMKTIFTNEEHLEEGLNMIYRSVSKGLTITQQIMDYSKVGHEKAGKQTVLIDQILQNLVNDNTTQLSEAGIRLNLKLGGGGLSFYGLDSHFDSIFKNLLFNAKDALLDKTIQDGRNKTITLISRVENKNYIVEVTDNGVGIPPENISKIYNAFFSTKPDTGTGLGLGIVLKIITMYGGTIDVKSEVNTGTTFTVQFPVLAGNQQ